MNNKIIPDIDNTNFSFNDILARYRNLESESWWTEDFKEYLKKLSRNAVNIATHLAKKWYYQNIGSWKAKRIGLRIESKNHWNKELIEWIDENEYSHPEGSVAGDRPVIKSYQLPKCPNNNKIHNILSLVLKVDYNEFCREIDKELNVKEGYPSAIKLTNKNFVYVMYENFALYLAEELSRGHIPHIEGEHLDRFVNKFIQRPTVNPSVAKAKVHEVVFSEVLCEQYQISQSNLNSYNFTAQDIYLVDNAKTWYNNYINHRASAIKVGKFKIKCN